MEEQKEEQKNNKSVSRFRMIAGVVLIIFGTALLFKKVFGVNLLSWLDWTFIWAVIFIFFGFFILDKGKK